MLLGSSLIRLSVYSTENNHVEEKGEIEGENKKKKENTRKSVTQKWMSKKNNKKETRCWDFFLPTDHNDGSQSADIGMGDNAAGDRSNEAIFEVDADHDDCDCDC